MVCSILRSAEEAVVSPQDSDTPLAQGVLGETGGAAWEPVVSRSRSRTGQLAPSPEPQVRDFELKPRNHQRFILGDLEGSPMRFDTLPRWPRGAPIGAPVGSSDPQSAECFRRGPLFFLQILGVRRDLPCPNGEPSIFFLHLLQIVETHGSPCASGSMNGGRYAGSTPVQVGRLYRGAGSRRAPNVFNRSTLNDSMEECSQ